MGIDLATDPRKCGVCVIKGRTITHVGHGSADPLHPSWLLRYCSGADAVGIDVPFGWPKRFIEMLCSYEIGAAFDRERRPYRLRTTDIWVNETLPQRIQRDAPPPNPFSVSTDKLGATAMVGTILLQNLSNEFEVSPRCSGKTPAVLEVYPSASLWTWGLRHRSMDVDSALRSLKNAFGLDVREDDRRQLLESRHCFDALVAALTALEYADGKTFDPPECVPDRILKMEGWIRVPTTQLQTES